MEYRAGIGYDIHRLVEGRKLFLGGVEIPYKLGLLGHSDADVLLHAICDALLGAAGKSDIGELFPDTEPEFHNIRSEELLKKVDALLRGEKFAIKNIDAVVVAQEPALSPFKKKITESISSMLGVLPQQINVKAKTNEGLDEVGKKNAIAAYVTALIAKEE